MERGDSGGATIALRVTSSATAAALSYSHYHSGTYGKEFSSFSEIGTDVSESCQGVPLCTVPPIRCGVELFYPRRPTALHLTKNPAPSRLRGHIDLKKVLLGSSEIGSVD